MRGKYGPVETRLRRRMANAERRRALRDAELARDGKGCFLMVAAIAWTLVVCGALLAFAVVVVLHAWSSTH